jgi:hypothetical protein
MMRWIPVAIALLMPFGAQAELYKWVDAQGNVHYTDTPPPAGARSTEKKKLGDKATAPTMPYVLQQATKNFPVTLFSYDCGQACTSASALLAKRGVPHTLLDPVDPSARDQLRKATGGDEVAPVLQVGRRVLKGYQEAQWNAALDSAGYPSTALVTVVPKTPPKPAPQPEAPAAEPGTEEQAPEASTQTDRP